MSNDKIREALESYEKAFEELFVEPSSDITLMKEAHVLAMAALSASEGAAPVGEPSWQQTRIDFANAMLRRMRELAPNMATVGALHPEVYREMADKFHAAILATVPQPAVNGAEPDIADIIAGALPTSRAHAYELMSDALAAVNGATVSLPKPMPNYPEEGQATYTKEDLISYGDARARAAVNGAPLSDAEIDALASSWVYIRAGSEVEQYADLRNFARDVLAATPDAQARPVADSDTEAMRDAFDWKFCPYKGSPDPWVVWQAAWKACRESAPTAPPAEASAGKAFQRAWIQLPKLPGGMMHSSEVGDFGQVPASCSAWITTSEKEMKSWNEPSIEVWLTRPAAPLSEMTDAQRLDLDAERLDLIDTRPAAPLSEVIDYTVLHEFSEKHRVSYNELCAAVRASIAATSAGEGAK